MGKLIHFFLLFYSLSSFSIVSDNLFQNDSIYLEKILVGQDSDEVNLFESSFMDRFPTLSKDPANRVSDTFNVPKYFKHSTHFWFNIYTVFDSNRVVLHDKKNLSIIYQVLDYSKLKKSNIDRITKISLQSKLTLEKVKLLKKEFLKLAFKKTDSKLAQNILRALSKAKVKIPKNKKKRIKYFKSLGNGLRAQTGQRDKILAGIKNYQIYKKPIDKYFSIIKQPKELLAIPFLESSFNTTAKSKVNATGAWQFMRRVARYFMNVNKFQDDRVNPLLSTISALHLLKQNKQVLKQWDLAVPAYNSGTKHLLKAKRTLKIPNIRLEHVLTKYKHGHIGFASKNFYSEFLALVYTLAYSKEIYGSDYPSVNKRSLRIKNGDVKIYITKCSLKPSWLFNALKKTSPDISRLNPHLLKKHRKRNYSKGTIIFSDIKLNSKRYFRITDKHIKRIYPKNWKKLVKNYRCSTK